MTSTTVAPERTGAGPAPRWRPHVGPLLAATVAAGLALTAIVAGWRGSDLPAHLFRIGLVQRDGFNVWNNRWFGGHHTLGYGPALPVLGAAVGVWTVAVASAAVAAAAVHVLIRSAGGRARWASVWFATGTLTNVAIGRLPFALGLAVAVVALYAAQQRRPVVAAVLTVLVAAASPVVSAFTALAFAAWAISGDRRYRRLRSALCGAAIAPVMLVAIIYPQGGTFPFRWAGLVVTLLVAAGVYVGVPSVPVIRTAAALYALASIIAFVVPTPLGGNISRLGMYAAGPVMVAFGSRRLLAVAAGTVVVPLLLFWQWAPAVDAVVRAPSDPSTDEEYYAPLTAFLDSVDADTSRTEVVPTTRHWESTYVALDFPIARGWERQLDVRFNPLFYGDDTFTIDEYGSWLVESGVRYVALSDAVPDRSGVREGELLAAGAPFLEPVWSSANWQVWEVRGSFGLVDGPAEVLEIDSDIVRLDVTSPGDVVVRVRSSAFWVSEPAVCIEPTDDGWIVLRDAPAGTMELRLDGTDLVTIDEPCDQAGGR